MSRSTFGLWLLVSVLLAVLLGATTSYAQYDKGYRFWLTDFTADGTAETIGARILLNGMEIITSEYTGWRNPWGYDEAAYPVVAGVPCTQVRYMPTAVDPGPFSSDGVTEDWSKGLRVGISTSDGSASLRDLRWVNEDNTNGASISPVDLSEVPGGGYIEKIAEGTYLWTISNDIVIDYDDEGNPIGWPLELYGLEYGAFDERLAVDVEAEEGLLEVAEVGIAGKRVNDIDDLITALWEDVDAAGEAGIIPAPSARSLKSKLEKARQYLYAGLEEWDAEDEAGAMTMWGRAISQMENLIKEMTNQSDRGNVPSDLYVVWKARAEEIIAGIVELPGAEEPEGAPTILLPGESYSFLIEGVYPPNSVVMHGKLVDDAGNTVLDWVEQAAIKDDMDPPAVLPDIDSETPPIDGVYHTPPTVTLTLDEPGYVDPYGVPHAIMVDVYRAGDVRPVDDQGNPLLTPSPQASPWSQTFGDGEYVITYLGVDAAGNTSPLQTLTITAVDNTAPDAPAVGASPPILWSPNKLMVPITLEVGTVTDDFPPYVAVDWQIVQVDDTLGPPWTPDGGDTADIWVIEEDGEQQLLLNAQRPGNPELSPRIYTIHVVAIDAAGNESVAGQAVVMVPHDQGN